MVQSSYEVKNYRYLRNFWHFMEIHCRVHTDIPVDPVLRKEILVHTTQNYLSNILNLYFHLCLPSVSDQVFRQIISELSLRLRERLEGSRSFQITKHDHESL
jgi:hypothetical protein